jgi:hypothetical protein
MRQWKIAESKIYLNSPKGKPRQKAERKLGNSEFFLNYLAARTGVSR